jgi:hypothetical protein
MAGAYLGGHGLRKSWHGGALGEERAAQHLLLRGDVGFADRLAAVGEEGLWRAAHAGTKAESTCSRINVRS